MCLKCITKSLLSFTTANGDSGGSMTKSRCGALKTTVTVPNTIIFTLKLDIITDARCTGSVFSTFSPI